MDQLPDNTLIFRFSQTPSKAFYVPHSATEKQDAAAQLHPVRRDVQSVVERSIRETKMQKSVDLEGLERLVAVSRIVKEGEAEVTSIEDRLKALMGEDETRDDLVSPIRDRSGISRCSPTPHAHRPGSMPRKRISTVILTVGSQGCVRRMKTVGWRCDSVYAGRAFLNAFMRSQTRLRGPPASSSSEARKTTPGRRIDHGTR